MLSGRIRPYEFAFNVIDVGLGRFSIYGGQERFAIQLLLHRVVSLGPKPPFLVFLVSPGICVILSRGSLHSLENIRVYSHDEQKMSQEERDL